MDTSEFTVWSKKALEAIGEMMTLYVAATPDSPSASEPSLRDVPVQVDPTLPPGTVEIRNTAPAWKNAYARRVDEAAKLHQQLAERNEDYKVLQDDMRRMAAENQRLRAFVQKIAMPHDNDIQYAKTYVLHPWWIEEARALLDTETD